MKKIISVTLVIVMVLALSVTAMASSTLIWKDGFGFHCNAGKGNGKVVTGFEKATIALERVGATTTWNLAIDVNNECPVCKRIDWVTFSNKNGVINGKNIQVNHSDNPVYKATASAQLVLIDIVIDCEGELVSEDVVKVDKSGVFATNEIAKFDFDIPAGYEIVKGENPVVIEFAAKAGQNLSETVVAIKTTVLECECEGDFFGGGKCPGWGVTCTDVCDPCKNGNGNNHTNCRTLLRKDHPQYQELCGCVCP
ncbi:MAG: hypothetical protein FWD44_09985 [Oscillospiraceae bacterium]|nr:hypothetical protein [Oscillospiraceae bacterium]